MRAIFFGTPGVATVALRALLGSRHDVVAVVTQPDRARGRSGTPQPSPVKAVAHERGIPVLQPAMPQEEGFADALRAFTPGVLAIVAYGHILPRPVLAVAPAVNAHFSLLPRYRGAAPVQRAIAAGERETGVTTFLLEPAVDAGPILLQQRTAIGDEETAGELLDRLATVGGRLLVESLDGLEEGTLRGMPQDPMQSSPAPRVGTDEVRIDWSRPAAEIANAVRAFNPAPGAWTTWRGKRLKIWRARALEEEGPGPPGSPVEGDGTTVAAGRGAVRLVQVQPEGGRRMTGEEFVRGHGPFGTGVFGREPGDR